jgi:hypothetical protein
MLSLRLLWTYKQSKVPQAPEKTFLVELKVKKGRLPDGSVRRKKPLKTNQQVMEGKKVKPAPKSSIRCFRVMEKHR